MDININLIRQCKNNNTNAFNTLLEQYEGSLYQICFSYTRNKEEALDIMQEVYIKVFRAIHSFEETRAFLPWLKKIAVNTCLNYKRDNEKHQHISIDTSDIEGFSIKNTIPSNIDVEKTVIMNETQKIISSCFKELPKNYRIALTLRYQEDMTYEDIAAFTEEPLGTVKSNIFRGREKLRKMLSKHELLEV